MQDSMPDRQSDYLTRLTPVDRDALILLTVEQVFNKGELIFKAGSPGNLVYFIETGRIKIYHLSPTGKEVLLWFCVPGEIFGLAEACQGGRRQIYAEACEPSRVLHVRQDDFTCFLERHPAASLLVNEVLSSRLRNLGNIIQSLVADDVNERVAQLIARLAANYGHKTPDGDIYLSIRLTHQEMANMIGTTRRSVTSVLGALKRLGILDVRNRHIHIHDATLLGTASAVASPSAPATR